MPKFKKKLRVKDKIGLVTLVVAIVTGVYFPLASHYSFFPFAATDAPLTLTPTAIPTQQLVLLNAYVEGTRNPILEIMVQNTGTQTAVLTKAILTVDKIWKLTPMNYTVQQSHTPSQVYPTAIPISWNYTVFFGLRDQNSCNETVNVAHGLAPDEPDRFRIGIKSNVDVTNPQYVLRMNVTLIYGEGKSLAVPALMYVIQQASFVGDYSLVSDEMKQVAQEIQDTSGTKTTELIDILSEILSK